MKANLTSLTPIFAALFALSSTAIAEEVTSPEPINVMGRHMPGFGNESIVNARYTVKADGTTDDVQVFGFLSNQFQNKMLYDTVKNWTFKPGTVDGKPVDIHNQEWMFAVRVDPNAAPPEGGGGFGGRFGPGAQAEAPEIDYSSIPTYPLALSPGVKIAVDEISGLVSEQEFKKALKEITKLMRSELHTVFDYSLSHELRASILMAQGELYEALESSMLATKSYTTGQGETAYFMTDDVLQSALHKRFLLAMSLRQNNLAISTYKEMQDKFTLAADDSIHQQAADIQAMLDSSDPLPLLAKIVQKQWSYTPTRRIFTVTDVDGRLKQINARCTRNNLELDYQEGVDWALPESLGDCVLDFVGKNNTTFTVYEFAE